MIVLMVYYRVEMIIEKEKMMKTYDVRLCSVGNFESPLKWEACNSFAECSRACLIYIAAWDLRHENWTGGQVQVDGCQVARVSFNGRVWDMGENEIEI